MLTSTSNRPVGDLIRTWRQRRRLSQMELASEADVSTRHVSFLETGRSRPSREMLLRIASRLEIPLRDQNALLVAAGFAPIYPERDLDDPALAAARQAIDLVLVGHEPFPAIAVDRHWTLIAANRAIEFLLAGVDPDLLRAPVNVLKLSLHPNGLAPHIANLRQWREHLLERLRHQIDVSADPVLTALLDELRTYPAPPRRSHTSRDSHAQEVGGYVVPMRLRTDRGTLSFLSTTTLFGTPVDVTLSELAIESFFPTDQETADILGQIAATWPARS